MTDTIEIICQPEDIEAARALLGLYEEVEDMTDEQKLQLGKFVQAFANHREKVEEMFYVNLEIPQNILDYSLHMGKVTCGKTAPMSTEEHGEEFTKLLLMEEEYMGEEVLPMNAVMLPDGETLVAFTGRLEAAQSLAEAIAGSLNWLHSVAVILKNRTIQ